MMKNIRLLLLSVLCLVFSGCQAKGQEPNAAGLFKPDSAVYKTLGKSLSKVLFQASSVRCYTVKNVRKPAEGDVAFDENFVLGAPIAKLSEKEIGLLQFLLPANRANYGKRAALVKSPYMPRLAFLFTKGKQRAWLLVSLADMSWSVYYDDKTQFVYDYTETEVVERFCNYFLNLESKSQTPESANH